MSTFFYSLLLQTLCMIITSMLPWRGYGENRIYLEKIEDTDTIKIISLNSTYDIYDNIYGETQLLGTFYIHQYFEYSRNNRPKEDTIYFFLEKLNDPDNATVYKAPFNLPGRSDVVHVPVNMFPAREDTSNKVWLRIAPYFPSNKEYNVQFNSHGGTIQRVKPKPEDHIVPLLPVSQEKTLYFRSKNYFITNSHLNTEIESTFKNPFKQEIYFTSYTKGTPCGDTPASCPQHRICMGLLENMPPKPAREVAYCLPWSNQWLNIKRLPGSQFRKESDLLEHTVQEVYPNPHWQKHGEDIAYWFRTRNHKLFVNFKEAYLVPMDGISQPPAKRKP
ncbi:MAG: hypothetical protein G8345_04095 [Magnetococcales bacterium]|nr:hypothetical protein [Magnetococcales bacterium]NGZ26053.1 hypothetical protein [Magnetococcales bacterium]